MTFRKLPGCVRRISHHKLTRRSLEVEPQSKLHLPRRTGSNQPRGVDHARDVAEASGIKGAARLPVLGTIEQIEFVLRPSNR